MEKCLEGLEGIEFGEGLSLLVEGFGLIAEDLGEESEGFFGFFAFDFIDDGEDVVDGVVVGDVPGVDEVDPEVAVGEADAKVF